MRPLPFFGGFPYNQRPHMNRTGFGRRLFGLARLAVPFLAAVIISTAEGWAEPLVVTWDASPDTAVAGYMVFVGTEPGKYTERYDAGETDSFAYSPRFEGVTYYFAVASYTSARVIGSLSEQVSAFVPLSETAAGPSRLDGTRGIASAEAFSGPSHGGGVLPQRLCPSAQGECFDIVSVLGSSGRVTSLASSVDGRVFAIEDGARVRIARGLQWFHAPALTVDSASVTLGTLVLDADFATHGLLFLSHYTTAPDGSRSMSIVRYRELANTLGEAAVVVSGVRLPADGQAPFTVDRDRRIYVALPANARETYAGSILRLEADGRVPLDSPGLSPAFAPAPGLPIGLIWDPQRLGLWLTAYDRSGGGILAQVPTDRSTGLRAQTRPQSANVPLKFTPAAIAVVASADGRQPASLALASSDFLYWYRQGAPTAQVYDVREIGRVDAVSGGPGALLYLSIIRSDGRPLVLQLRQP
jgi:hypothetical protein